MTLHRILLVPAAALLAAGCASLEPPSFAPGTSMADVESRLGRPPSVVKAPGGETVWQYPKGPNGQRTYVADFGPDQRLKRFYQALTIEEFAKIRIGMPEDEIRLLFGPPGETMFFSRMNEQVWSYHYQASWSDNRIFNVHFDASSRAVRSTSDQVDPLLNPWNMGSGPAGM
ncbi:MAG TPA: hypothetical protein VML91_24615 [Burkholderiales bacterium]|nr:hypothetical protein [Burkholderiales bacterium]